MGLLPLYRVHIDPDAAELFEVSYRDLYAVQERAVFTLGTDDIISNVAAIEDDGLARGEAMEAVDGDGGHAAFLGRPTVTTPQPQLLLLPDLRLPL